MSHHRLGPLLAAAVLAIMLPLGASALASTNGVAVASHSGDGATLTLSAKAKRSFAGQHVALKAQRPATRRKATYALPDSSGNWNFAKATGTLNLKGILHIVLGKRSVAMKSVTFTRPAKGNGQLTAKIAGHKLRLFTVTGKVHVKQSGTTETLTGMTAKLTKPGATKLNKALHKTAFKANQAIGSFTVKVSTTALTGTSPGAPGAPGAGSGSSGVTPTSSSGVGVALAPAFRSLLDSVGLSTLPLVPASGGLPAPLGTTPIPGADGTSLSLPLAGGTAGGSFDQGTLTGTIPLSGGLQLGNGQVSASLTNPTLTLGTGTEGSSLSFQVNGGPEVKLFDIDTSQLEQAATPDGSLDLNGLLATLSSEGASTLNTILGQNVFTTGQPVGGISVILPAAATG
ncbi:MAG TPA: hypothetical protein VMB27_17455 [Solirubrobacteraceae bacterium]|nr:hypothetical protein [Solirubrobacteraceae bacterium]